MEPLPRSELWCLSTALCPNAVTQQRLAALHYLCYKRFVEVRVPWLEPRAWAWRGRGAPGEALSPAARVVARKGPLGAHFCREACLRRTGLTTCR